MNRVALLEDSLPAWIWSSLNELYGSMYCSLPWIMAHEGTCELNAAVIYQNDLISSVFIYRCTAGKLRVINECAILRGEDVELFVAHMFSTRSISSVVFHAVEVATDRPRFPGYRAFCSEDFVIQLPGSAEEYAKRLGAATRKNIRRHLNRLERNHPSFSHRVVTGAMVEEWQIREIVRLNAARMHEKNVVPMLDESEVSKLIQLVRVSGEVGIVTIDGAIRAGSIVVCVGHDVISRVLAHDPLYNEDRLGTLCCYLTICDFIKRGAKRFHLMAGPAAYKGALLGEYRPLYHVVRYRSWQHAVMDAPDAVRNLYIGKLLETNRTVLGKLEHDTSLPWRTACRLLRTWRTMWRRKERPALAARFRL
ncbi:MAG: family N-acetyltransferase [Herminiimonas sp.]|nr:family N-acetyltransferase [Herminiimonas sp.]